MPRRVLIALLTLAIVTACNQEDPMAAPRTSPRRRPALKTASGLASKVLIVGLGTVREPASRSP